MVKIVTAFTLLGLIASVQATNTFQLRGTFDTSYNTATTSYNEKVEVKYTLSDNSNYWYSLGNYTLNDWSYTTISINAGTKKVTKLVFVAYNTDAVRIGTTTIPRGIFFNDNRFMLDGRTIFDISDFVSYSGPNSGSVSASLLKRGRWTWAGRYTLDFTNRIPDRLPTQLAPASIPDADCDDPNKKMLCMAVIGGMGPGDDQEKINVHIVRKDGSVDTYYRYYLLPKSNYGMLKIDTEYKPGAARTKANSEMASVRISFLNDISFKKTNTDRNVFVDWSKLKIYGRTTSFTERPLAFRGDFTLGSAQMDNATNGEFKWFGNYTVTYLPNACTVTKFCSLSSDRLCLRLKSSSVLSNSTVQLNYITSANPTTPINRTLTLGSNYENIPIDLSTGTLQSFQVNIGSGQVAAILDVSNIRLNGNLLSEDDVCLNDSLRINGVMDVDLI